jgi:enoyl-CoA hydratase/carnithine racemase
MIRLSEEFVTYRQSRGIAYITLNRPEVHNAIHDDMRDELRAALDQFDFDTEANVAILHGNGPSFCVGADVKERFVRAAGAKPLRQVFAASSPVGYLGHTAYWKPVIAAVHGWCVGAGIGLALESDLIVASEDARFGVTETKRGLASGHMWARLQTFMPSKIASEMLLLGEPMAATELYRLGAINRLVPVGQHLTVADELARTLRELPPLAVRANVRLIRRHWTDLGQEGDFFSKGLQLQDSEDFRESSAAFVEKRPAHFTGR